MESRNRDVAQVPSTVTVAAGSTTATFTIQTSSVNSSTQVIISAEYLGVQKLVTLTVGPPTLEPKFTVTSSSLGENACKVTNSSGSLDCTLDASASRGQIEQYLWTYTVDDDDAEDNPRSAITTPEVDCGLLDDQTLDSEGRFNMTIALRLRGRDGTTSSAVSKTVKITPDGYCSYD